MERRYEAKFQSIFATLLHMLEAPIPPKNQIGFHATMTSRKTRR